MNPIEQKLINEIIQAIQELKGYLVDERQVQIQIPKDHQNGDYSSNIAMRLAKVFQQKPIELATELAAYLEQKSDLIEKAEVAGPGFLNFWVKQDELTSVISKVIEMDQDYGRNDSGNQLKINVEYISVNPTGLLHMGHARGAAWGDSITRLMKFSNYEVTREYYVNDGGNQIEALVYSLLERYKQFHGLDYQLPEDGYHSEDLLEIVEQLNQRHGREFLDWPLAKQLAVLEDEGVELELARIKSDLKKFNVEMDVYTSEKAIREQFDMEDLLEQLRQAGYVYQEDGAQWFKSSVFGDDKDRVLKKSDGTYTYLTPDILYHKYKLDRGFKKLINIFGADHHGYIPRLKAAI
ncbi:MAG TPA: arginine--tRNA ligase, partial [Erysipelothrix sp.]|nr:arginine--tRNA ligase [Erysipelothrix sp.]